MKRFFKSLLYSTILLSVSFAVSCVNNGENTGYQGVPTIEVTPASVKVGLAGGTTEAVTVTTPAEWVVESDTEGVVASMPAGNGDATVTFEVPATESARTIKITFIATGYVSNYPITKKASLSITQSDSDIPTVDGEFVYYDNCGESVSKVDGYWPYVDAYTGWAPTGGEGFDQSGVTYTGKNASVRNSGKTWAPVGATYATDAPYAYLQAKSDTQFVINNIAIKSGVKSYTFSFTAFNQYASLIASPYTPVVTALESGKNLTVAVSVDGANWGNVAFTTMADGNWTYAIAPFTLPADASKLYVRFSDYKADTTTPLPSSDYQYQAALRFDDFRLVEGGNGPVVEFNNAGGGSTEAKEATIEQILAGGEGNYTLKNAYVVANYAQGFLLTDATAKYILCYQGTGATVPAVGSVVEVNGAVTTYAGLLQFGKEATVTTSTETKSVEYGTAVALTGADLDKYVTAPEVKYASFEGALSISGSYYNVTVEGATTAIGSISYPTTEMAAQLKELNGKGIKATGFMIGVSSSKYTNMMITAVQATGNDPEPTPEPEPIEGTYTLVNSVDQVKAGKYYMAGYAEEYNNQGNVTTFAPYPYHMWTGGISTGNNSDLMTVNYSYTDGKLQINPYLSAQDAAKGTAQLVELVAVEGKSNTYNIKFGDKYLTCTGKRKAELVDTAVEWTFSAHEKGGICLTDNGVILGTAGATYNLLRCYAAPASSLLYGVVFFAAGEGGTTPEPEPTPSQTVAINTITADGTYAVEGIVVAVGAKAYVVADSTGSLLVYGAEHGRTLMEKVTVEGSVSRYKGYTTNALQMAATTTTVVSTDNTYEYKPLVIDGATLDTMVGADAACIEVQITGVISVGSYANITVEGATKQASLYYVNTADYAAFDGKNVVVKGYITGTYNYLNILPYSVTEVGGTTPTPEPTPTPSEYTTVADFIAAAEDDTIYTLKGTITSVANTTFGNFDLTDETGTVLIYGLCSPEGESKYWAASGAKLGDDIVVKTVRTSYSNTPQGKDAIFVELITPGTIAFWSFDKSIVSFTAAAGSQSVAVEAYNLKSDVVAVSDNSHFSASYADGVLTINAAENTTTDVIKGNITVTCGTLEKVIAVSQSAPSTGGEQQVVDATVTFDSLDKRTSKSDEQAVWEENGITVVNDKDASTTNIADYVAPARFYKSSKITVTAPGTINVIVFDCNTAAYATSLAKSIGSSATADNDKVTVALDGSSTSYSVSLTDGQVRMDSLTVTYTK